MWAVKADFIRTMYMDFIQIRDRMTRVIIKTKKSEHVEPQ
jgi:hypothetical protein